MVCPILACENPYEVSDIFKSAGWRIDFSQSIESGDPLVGISLFGNSILFGVTEGYVKNDDMKYLGCGVVIYITVPHENIHEIYSNHKAFNPTNLQVQPWGDLAFEVTIGEYRFMIATS